MAGKQPTRYDQYDVIIIGGGMVGLSLALTLQKMLPAKAARNFPKVLLLESKSIQSNQALQPGFDVRSTVLSYGTVSYLKKLGIWDALEPAAEPISTIHVSDQNHFGQAKIKAEEAGVDALGYVVENQAIGLELNRAILESSEQVEVLSPVQVNDISHQQHNALLECESNEEHFTLQASLVVVAEGGRSGLSEKLGIYRKQKQYKQVAIIANVGFSQGHNNVAYERFTPNGPLAVLPLKNYEKENRAALVWTQEANSYKEIFELSDADFLAKLQEEFGQRLGTFLKVGERAAFPLSLQEAEEQIRHNLVLLGNVAHSLHPVAGQGFNLAFRDMMRLAENISDSFKHGQNPGDFSQLQKYLASTQDDQMKTIGFSHYLTQFFSSNQWALVWYRKFGLLSIDVLPPLKQVLSSQAMGVSDRMVKL
jgi:2-polyprenyl-6-methoxyphenol 4-hydroxylase